MKVVTKLSLGFLFVVMLIWVTVFFAQNTYNRIESEFEMVSDDIVPSVVAMSEMEILSNQIAYELVAYINTGNEEDKQAILSATEQLRAVEKEYLENETRLGPEAQHEAEVLLEGVDAFASSAIGLINLEEMDIGISDILLEEVVYPLFPVMIEQVEEYKAVRMAELAAARESARAAYTSGIQILLLAAGLVTLLAIAAAFLISRSIIKPLRALREGIEVIGKGDLSYRVGTRVKDEIGQLSRAFDRMTEQLNSSTTSIESLNKEIAEREQAEASLKLQTVYFQQLFDNSPEAIVLLDDQNRIVRTNHGFETLYGYAMEEVGGKAIAEVIVPPDRVEEASALGKAILKKKINRRDTVRRRKDGSLVDVSLLTYPIQLGEKAVGGYVIYTDITERKQMEEDLQAEKNKLESVIDSIGIGLSIQDKDYNIIYQNEPSKAAVGDNRGKKCYRAYAFKDDICEGCLVAEAFQDGQIHTAERTRVEPSGRVTFWENTASPIRDAQGNIVSCIEITKDITERKQVEQTLVDEAARRRVLIDQSLDGIVVLDEGAKVYEANPKFAEMLGYTPEEVQELHAWDWDTQWSREQLLEMSKKIDENGFHLETYHQRKDGSKIDVEISANGVVFGGQRLSFCVCRDITGRKQAEEELQAEKNKLQSLIDSMEDGLNILDKDFNLIYQNEPVRKLYGDRVGEKCYRVYEGREKVCDNCPIKKAFKDGRSHTSERKIIDPSGEIAYWENTASPIKDAKGKIVHCLEITRNITDRKGAEEQIRKQNEFLNTILNSLSHPFYVLDTADYTVKMSNQAAKEKGLADATTCYGLIYKRKRPCSSKEQVCPLEKVKKTKKAVVMEHTRHDGNGGVKNIEVHGYPIFDAKGKVTQMIEYSLDITERKRIEEELQESQRFSSTLMQNSPNPVLVLDPDASVRYVNPAFEKLTGFNLAEILGVKTPHPWWPEESREEIGAALKKAMAMGGKRGERIFQKKNGERFWVALTSTGVNSQGKQSYFLLNMLDITDSKRMQEALRESEEKLESMFDSVTDGIVVARLDGAILKVNESAVRMHGFDSQYEMLSKNALELAAPAEHKKMIKNMGKAVKQGNIRGVEYTLVRADGTEFPAELSTSALADTSGKVFGHITIARDITRRKEMLGALRESEEKFSKAFRASPDAIAITSLKDGVFMEVNDNFLATTGWAREEVINHKANEIGLWAKAKDREKMLKILKEQGRVHNEEFEFRIKSGEIRVWLFSSELIDIGNDPCLISMTIDITERKRAEEALKQKMEELRIAYQKLKELDQLKDSFLSTVSHELRTPLTSIKSFSEILLTYEEDRETQKEFLNIIKEESDRLTRLINDFLDLSKIESGRMQWEMAEISVADVIKTAVNATQALVVKGNLEVKTEISPKLPDVMCDKDRLVQVITNLLSNAIKFTPEKGKIKVKARILEKDESKEKANMVVVGVTDSGIGIDPKDHKGVFEKFKQVGNTLTDKPKGTGLGLPICKEIVEHFGGKLWVESALGKGSTFFFSLPMAQAAEIEALEAEETVEEEPVKVAITGNKCILVVDDEANIRRFLGHELKKRGYGVLQASGGNQAIELARKHHPDLITLDVLMGGMSGFDVTAVLKNDPQTKDIPILIISVVEDRKRAYQLGVNDYLTKPFRIESLMEKVNHLLRDAQKKILVVDDDKNLAKSLKYQLGKRGYSTNVAQNGRLALENVEHRLPDLILLDIMMPEMDGYEVMKALKHKPETAQIPILVMTGVEIDGSRVKALSVGATDYFTKSGGFDQMFETIENILSGNNEDNGD